MTKVARRLFRRMNEEEVGETRSQVSLVEVEVPLMTSLGLEASKVERGRFREELTLLFLFGSHLKSSMLAILLRLVDLPRNQRLKFLGELFQSELLWS